MQPLDWNGRALNISAQNVKKTQTDGHLKSEQAKPDWRNLKRLGGGGGGEYSER